MSGAAAADVQEAPAPAEQVEAATAASVCANCGAPRRTPYCGQCGQSAKLHTRLRHLLQDVVQGIANLDGRVWRTLPLLVLRPGRLSRAWIEGKRVRYVAPMTMFLFSFFVLFLASNLAGGFIEGIAIGFIDGGATDASPGREGVLERALSRVAQDPKYYGYKSENLAAQLAPLTALLFLPVMALLTLGLRGYTFYDHGVVTLYGFSFLALLQAVVLLALGVGGPVLAALLLATAPAHVVAHLRGAYAMTWLGAVVRGVV
ncbi:MAG TPA: DUF3667 domain-containing protein, partial [Caulobacteraceae bacterium]